MVNYYFGFIMIGEKFGFLTVTGKSTNNGKGTYKTECICECGKTHFANTSKLRSGRTKSCGCKRTTHGLWGTPEYTIWAAMIQRCNNPNNCNYENYGARGISVCKEWLRFERFISDMGERPSNKHSIDRLDNDGDYTPQNCEWRTAKQQRSNTSRNVFYTYGGETMTISQWAEKMRCNKNTLRERIVKLGWSIEKAITTPVKKRTNKH
jgi:hypothetical protein